MPRFTASQYEEIADAISEEWQNATDELDSEGIAKVAHRLADIFGAADKRFKRILFLEQCGDGVLNFFEEDEA